MIIPCIRNSSMVGRETVLTAEVRGFTPDEPWTSRRVGDHFYNALADFAVENLKGPGTCLVIGSPIFEAEELANSWSVTYIDVRDAPFSPFIKADATNIPISDSSVDAVSSTCVLCHIGLGRYGDPLVDNGDIKMLREIARLLKSGGLAVLAFGPVYNGDEFIRIGTFHRVYTIKEALRMSADAGLAVMRYKIYGLIEGWLDEVPVNNVLGSYYLSMLLKK